MLVNWNDKGISITLYSFIPIDIHSVAKVSQKHIYLGIQQQLRHHLDTSAVVSFGKGPFKYYVNKEVGGWGQKMAIYDNIQYSKASFYAINVSWKT